MNTYKLSIMKERNICLWDIQQRSLNSKEVREGFPEEVKLMVRSSGWKGVSDVKEVRNRQVNTCKGGGEDEGRPKWLGAKGKEENGRRWCGDQIMVELFRSYGFWSLF